MPSSPDRSPFRHTLRVYWEDTDAGGVVFYANYLRFFERARTEWLRSFGHSQQRLREETGAIFVVAETSIRYLRPARLDDLLDVTVEVLEAGRATMLIAQQALARRRAAGRGHDPHRLRRCRDAAPAPHSDHAATTTPHEPGPLHLHPRAAREPRRADRHGGPAARLAGELERHLRQAVRAARPARRQRRVRARVLGRQEPERPLRQRAAARPPPRRWSASSPPACANS